jgi:hypothetical protein
MSYIVLSDRVKEISYSIGTGSFALEGAVQGFSSFGEAYSDGNNLFYAITDGTDYEVGSGVYVTGIENGLVRFPLRSSNGNNLVDFETGLKEVFVTYPGTHSVYHASGYASEEAPVGSGIAFWLSSNVIGYDSSFLWDNTNNRLGINKLQPSYAIDIGGYGPDAIVQSSGFIVGTSGLYFPTGINGDSEYPGGRQVVHFEPNDVLDEDSKTTIGVSGDVNQYIYFEKQAKGFVFAGPPSGCEGACSPAVPQFRPLSIEDIPDLNSLYATDVELQAASGALNVRIVTVSGMLDEASGVLNNGIVTVSGMLDEASGVLNNGIVTVSGMLDEASGVLDNGIVTVSGMLDEASGVLNNGTVTVSGMINTVSGIAEAALGSGVTIEQVLNTSSGIVIASGTEFLSDLVEVSGLIYGTIISSGSVFNEGIVTVSGMLEEASGVLDNDIVIVSGMVISSGTRFIDDLEAASGDLFNSILASSGIADRLNIDLTGTTNTARIINNDAQEPTHFRLVNASGIGSRLLLESSSGVDGNTWANVSLNDGGYRIYNYTYNWNIEVSGQPSSTQIILNSGTAWRELLPIGLSGISVSGSFLNNGHPSGVKIVSQEPASGHILTIEAHPGQSLITSSPSLPETVDIFYIGVNGLVVNKDNNVGINLDPQAITSDLDIRGDGIRIRNSGVVPTSSSVGYTGEIKWDENYIYVCTSNNTWKRAALETWTPATTSTFPP